MKKKPTAEEIKKAGQIAQKNLIKVIETWSELERINWAKRMNRCNKADKMIPNRRR